MNLLNEYFSIKLLSVVNVIV